MSATWSASRPWSRTTGCATRQADRPAAAERLARFSEQGLSFVTDTGETLQAELRLAEPRLRKDRVSPFAGMINPFTRGRVPDAPADKRVLYVELVYPFADGTPKTLTISPPLDAEGRPRVTIGFIVYHKSVPVIDFRYLGAPSTLTLDPDPWYSTFDNPNLKRHHKDALMSYLYVEPYEVRHEILTRVKDLGEWMDLGLRGERYIEIDELEPLKARIGAFLLQKNPVTGGRRGAAADPRSHQLRQGRAHRHPDHGGPRAPGDRLGHRRRHHQLPHRRPAAGGDRGLGAVHRSDPARAGDGDGPGRPAGDLCDPGRERPHLDQLSQELRAADGAADRGGGLPRRAACARRQPAVPGRADRRRYSGRSRAAAGTDPCACRWRSRRSARWARRRPTPSPGSTSTARRRWPARSTTPAPRTCSRPC